MRKGRWLGALAGVAVSMLAGATPAAADTPAEVVSVTIQGEAVVGATLEAVVVATGDPTPTIDYQWARCDESNHCANISDATASTYTIADADVGYALIVRVTATNSSGTDDYRSDPTATVAAPAPAPAPAPEPAPAPAPTPSPAPAPTTAATSGSTAVAQAPPASTFAAPEPVAAPVGGLPVVVASPRLVHYLRPFPVVRVSGLSVRGGAYIELLRVTAPRRAKVNVTCRGQGCPVGRLSARPGRIRQLERFLPTGVTITIRVTRSGYIGKFVRLVIRSRAAPARRDACLLPGRTRPARCPG